MVDGKLWNWIEVDRCLLMKINLILTAEREQIEQMLFELEWLGQKNKRKRKMSKIKREKERERNVVRLFDLMLFSLLIWLSKEKIKKKQTYKAKQKKKKDCEIVW